ncbi:helix-hairpin-helix domain-containing protein [Paenibacillus sp. FSL R5-0407]|uniref:ComEA family DNA-binding protein n=1 Tax=Paenibacillus sp. FSL R5-0407 TaxID=2975320 RepID=UPI0030FA6D01
MKREHIILSVVSAVVGAGLMLLALGGAKPSGIEGWIPVNESVASAMSLKDDGSAAAGGYVEPAKQAGGEDENTVQLSGNGSEGGQKAQNSTDQTVQGISHVPEANALPGDSPVPGITGDSAGAPAAAVQQQHQSGLISINTAGTIELQEIPGIGEKKAQAIVDYRNAHGPFKSVNELTKVKGIGDKMLEKMKPHIGL